MSLKIVPKQKSSILSLFAFFWLSPKYQSFKQLEHKNFNTIGIGVTFSPNLKANIYEASRLAMLFQAKLLLIHVGDVSEEKRDKFEAILKPFIIDGLDAQVAFQPGEPVDAILETVVKQNIDLLILGAVQRESFLKYYVGSIARKITRKVTCSVMLLINPSVERIPCKHIVVNGLEDKKTEQTVATAFMVAAALNSDKITIVEEISHDKVGTVEDTKSLRKTNLLKEKIKRQEESRVQTILSHIPEKHKENRNIATQAIFGKRGYSIGHFAQVVRADLLVMNAPEKTGFFDRLFPHDIEHILTELPNDVLIIR
jgi:nucleotide-binding universal stress UspA family protein